MDSENYSFVMPSVIDKYSSIEVDDSEGEELDYYIDNCLLDNFTQSSQSVPNYTMEPFAPKFLLGKNMDSPSEKPKPSNPIVKRQRSPRSHDFGKDLDNGRTKRVPEPAKNIPMMHNGSQLSDNLNKNSLNVSRRRANHSLSPHRVIPFEVFERNYQTCMRSHSVSPSRKISYADPQVLQKSDKTRNSFPRLDVVNEQRQCNLATIAPLELLKRNYRRMEWCHSLPSFSDSGQRTESTFETEKRSTNASDLSREVPDWFTPPRASTVRLSQSVLERHSLSSGTLSADTYSPNRRLLSWIRSQTSL